MFHLLFTPGAVDWPTKFQFSWLKLGSTHEYCLLKYRYNCVCGLQMGQNADLVLAHLLTIIGLTFVNLPRLMYCWLLSTDYLGICGNIFHSILKYWNICLVCYLFIQSNCLWFSICRCYTWCLSGTIFIHFPFCGSFY